MIDLYEEFDALIAALDERRIEYALCGGIAMAVYGVPRATVDIDLLIAEDSLEAVCAAAEELGYTLKATPMRFAGGKIEIRRVSKLDAESGEVLTLDLLLVTTAIKDVWEGRREIEWERGKLRVVSREGLIELKSLRNSGQDKDDIMRLRELSDES
ncbi:MAG: nucleotidyl transferase AbiEii/AbiGii toxin family protein [Acidobacteriota bacterium]